MAAETGENRHPERPVDVGGLVNRYQDDATFRQVVDILSDDYPVTRDALAARRLLDLGWSLVRGGDAGLEPGVYTADTSADGYYLTLIEPAVSGSNEQAR